MKRVIIGIAALALSGCQSLQQTLQEKGMIEVTCIETVLELNDQPCQQLAWLDFWQQQQGLAWRERKSLIEQLGDGPADRLKMAMLSFASDTPYQARLRAQHNLAEIAEQLTPGLANLTENLLVQPNQQLLEFESALVTLNKINTRNAQQNAQQAVKIEQLQRRITDMQKQIDALLKIETNLTAEEDVNEQ